MDAKLDGVNHLEQFSKAVHVVRDKALEVLMLVVFRVTRMMVLTLQKFTWAVQGVERTRRDAQRGLQFKQSAHLQEIFWRRRSTDHTVADTSHFITTHGGFRPPSYIFKPGVTLYCITKKEAIFIEMPPQAQQGPYMHDSQFSAGIRLVCMPWGSFHKMAQDVGDPRIPVSWLACTQRAGATLVSQAMSRVPGMLVLSEPDAVTTLATLKARGCVRPEEYKQLLASCVRLLCHRPDDRNSAVFIKGRPSATAVMEDLVQIFPRFRYLFMYRSSGKSLASNMAQLHTDPAPRALRHALDSPVLAKLAPFVRTRFYNSHVLINERKVAGLKPGELDTAATLAAAWAASVARVADMRYRGYHVLPFLYEDFMLSPRRALASLLQVVDVRREHLGPAAEALKSTASGSAPRGPVAPAPALTPQARAAADKVLRAYGLAKLGERFELAGLLKLDVC